MIIDVKEIVEKEVEALLPRVSFVKKQGVIPKLAVIMSINNQASKIYVKNKRKMCEKVGILQEEYIIKAEDTTRDVVELVEKLNQDESIQGILVQLPLDESLDEEMILQTIEEKKDVDGFNTKNIGKLALNQEAILPCTVRGIITILDRIGTSYSGKNVVVIGRSKIVGKPISYALLNRNCTVTVCHSKTQSIEKFTKDADILIVAAGVPGIINGEMVKPGSIVIDVGINRCNSKIIGDVVTDEVAKVASYVTSVPGGVGLTTVLSLAQNLVEICESRVSFVKN
ncbi:bifunctional protein FolD [Clostridium sp. CAG:921]|nr:bifunctional protein FolD [Clostridium sp. CAG:921]